MNGNRAKKLAKEFCGRKNITKNEFRNVKTAWTKLNVIEKARASSNKNKFIDTELTKNLDK